MKTTRLLHKISTNTKSTHHKTRGSPYTERMTSQIDRKNFREVDELYYGLTRYSVDVVSIFIDIK